MAKIKTLFLDIGGVILTNGWDRHMRERAAHKFGLDRQAFEQAHRQWYDLYEKDQISVTDYLDKVIFYESRNFTSQEFLDFMLTCSQPIPGMIDLIIEVKKQYGLRVAAVSNEGRFAAEYRIKQFGLASFIDDFFMSCFVHLQKPDPKIYIMALEVTQTHIENAIYLDDRAHLVEAAAKLGIKGIVSTSEKETRENLIKMLS